MLRKNKLPLILSSFIVLLPCLVGIMLQLFRPKIIASDWSGNGTGSFWNAKIALLSISSFFMLAVHWLCALLILKDPKNKTQSEKVLNLGLLIIPVLSLICGCTLIEAATGKNFGLGFITQIFLSTIFFVLGNYMPKCKPNHSIGIKVSWTLHSEENWNKTHRITGMFWVAGSVTMFLFIMVFESGFISKTLPILFIMVAGPILFSVLYYKKQLKEGSVKKIKKEISPPANRSFAFSSTIGAIIVIVVAVIFISGTIEYRFNDESLTIKANYWENATVTYSEVDSIEYREVDLIGKRIIGFSSFSIQMGEYDNSEFGSYTRYSYSNCKSCVVVRADDRVLILNKKDEKTTKELYETLLTKVRSKEE